MNITFRCTSCDRIARITTTGGSVGCPHCGAQTGGSIDDRAGGRLDRCAACPSTELFVRKDFPQGMGLSIIAGGFILSSIALAWHHVVWSLAILVATAAVDAVLYAWVGGVLTCYRCHAEHRGVAELDRHPAFRLEIHERYRQQAARLAEGERDSARRTVL